MLRLASLLYPIIGTSLAGIFIIIALVAGMDTVKPIVIASLAGFVLAVPVCFVVAKRLG